MNRLRGLLVSSGLCFGLMAASALALPPVLERVPDNAAVALAIPAPQTLEKNLTALSTAIGAQFPLPTMKDLLTMGGMAKGVDDSKSLAIVLFAPKQPEKAEGHAPGAPEIVPPSEDDAVFLVPVTSYADLLQNFEAKPAGEGKVDTITLPDGSEGFAKDIGGGYAAIGSNKAIIESFTGKPGDQPFKARMGKAGEALADAADVVTVVNMDVLRPLAREGVEEMKKEAKGRLEALGQDADSQMAVANWIGETIVRDTRMVTSAIRIGTMGVSLDSVGAFNDGSYLAKVFATKGEATPLLSKLPIRPFLFAGAMDTSAPAVKQLFRDLISKTSIPGGENAAKVAAASIADFDGQSGVVGFPQGGALSGLLTSTVTFTKASDPAAALKTIKESVLVMNDQTIQGMTYKATITDAGAKVGDTPVDVWEWKISSDGSNQMAAQGMQMIFGSPTGASGFLAKSDTGVYRTFAKNSDLLGAALGVGKGTEALSTDAMLKQVGEQLPKSRVAEGYLGVKSLLDMVLPLATMAGVPVPADQIPEKLPPLGMSVSADSGAARLSLFVPAPVIKVGVAMGESFMQMQDDGMGGGEPAPADKGKSGAGQPKF